MTHTSKHRVWSPKRRLVRNIPETFKGLGRREDRGRFSVLTDDSQSKQIPNGARGFTPSCPHKKASPAGEVGRRKASRRDLQRHLANICTSVNPSVSLRQGTVLCLGR